MEEKRICENCKFWGTENNTQRDESYYDDVTFVEFKDFRSCMGICNDMQDEFREVDSDTEVNEILDKDVIGAVGAGTIVMPWIKKEPVGSTLVTGRKFGCTLFMEKV